jgi:hypothetical protein
MGSYLFNQLARKHFQYLIDDYGFTQSEDIYDPEFFGFSVVEFRSATAIVRLDNDHGGEIVFAYLGDASDPKGNDHISMSAVVQYLNPEDVNPEAFEAVKAIRSDSGWDTQLREYARILHQYCELFLQPDFQWGEFHAWQDRGHRAFMEFFDEMARRWRAMDESKRKRWKDLDAYVREFLGPFQTWKRMDEFTRPRWIDYLAEHTKRDAGGQ